MKQPTTYTHRRAALEIAVALGFCLTLLTTAAFARYNAACEEICADTLRLHILANSDTPADQMLKLQVRDAVLQELKPYMNDAQNKSQAIQQVQRAVPALYRATAETLRAAGSEQSVAIKLEQTGFAAKQYDGFRLPGGEYTALRIELGRAEGHNWFCVLYPSLCLAGSSASYQKAEENAVVFGGYEVRFLLLDTARALMNDF